MRIFRWLDPEAQGYADHFAAAHFDWLAVTVQGEELDVSWTDLEVVEQEDGTVLVAGRDALRPRVRP